jgi:hypothetical protein
MDLILRLLDHLNPKSSRQALIVHGSIDTSHIYLQLNPNGKSIQSVVLGIQDSAIDLAPVITRISQDPANTNITQLVQDRIVSDIQDLLEIIDTELQYYLEHVAHEELSLVIPHQVTSADGLDALMGNIEILVGDLANAVILDQELSLDQFSAAHYCQSENMMGFLDHHQSLRSVTNLEEMEEDDVKEFIIAENASGVSLAHLTVAR